MKRFFTFLLLISFTVDADAQVKILFDATKAETAGNADWVIDADVFNLNFSNGPATIGGGNEANPQKAPTPGQSGITSATSESYWKGGISYWGIDCVKQGYQVETLPYDGIISYGNTSNAQDLFNYKIYVIVEPNILFTTTEKTAIINFVKNGGSLFIVSDHNQSDRNNDGHDSPEILNDLFTNNGVQSNPFGISFDLVTMSGTSNNTSAYTSDSLLHGSFGNVTQVLWSSGTTMTINPTDNSSVRAAVYKNGSSKTGTINVLVAYARYGAGKVVAFGDSSPFDDGSGDTNDQLYDGYISDAGGNHQKLIMNATIWLATSSNILAENIDFNAIQKHNDVQINWSAVSEVNTAFYNIQKSVNGKDFYTIASQKPSGSNKKYSYSDVGASNTITEYYRLETTNKDGSKNYSRNVEIKNTPENSILFYPNPANDIITFKDLNIDKIEIFNCYGSLVASYQAIIHSSINIHALPSGNYFIRIVNSNGQISTEKLSKY